MGKKLTWALVMVLVVAPLLGAWCQDSSDKTTAPANQAPATQVRVPTRLGGVVLDGVTKTIYLSNSAQPTEMQDIVNTLRTIVEIQRITMIPTENIIVMRGTPEQIALAEKLVGELDAARNKYSSQYRIEVKVTEIESGKKVGSKSFTLLVDPHREGELNVDSKAPSQTAVDAQVRYVEGSQNVRSRIYFENERDVALWLAAKFLNLAVGDSPQNTILPKVEIENQFKIELGKPTVVSTLDVPNSKSSFQLELAVTRVPKSKS